MSQIDELSRQGAQIAQQAAKAARDMASEAHTLRDSVLVFKLGGVRRLESDSSFREGNVALVRG